MTTEGENAHTGGTATCENKAICSVCGKEYGDLAEHIPNADDGDCTTDITCSVCGTVTTEGENAHTGGTATCTEKAICSSCGKEYGSFGNHIYGTLINAVAEKHTQTELSPSVAAHYYCACGKYFTEAKVETTLADLIGETPSHSYGAWKNDANSHWKECSCGKKSDEGKHIDANNNNMCDTCDRTTSSSGITPRPVHTHNYGMAWKTDGANHWHECSCGSKKDFATHSGGTATCQAKAKCTACQAMYGELAEHKYSEATCTAKAKCVVCGNETGELATHTYIDGKCNCGAIDSNYQPPHEHIFIEGKCECGEYDPNYQPPHEHIFIEGKCECGEYDPNYQPPHEHIFIEGKCECGENDPNYTPLHEHNFVEGKCECGASDPYYTPQIDDPEQPHNGLDTGEIIAIAFGSVTIVGVGGIALLWFVIKKKTLADLIAILKK